MKGLKGRWGKKGEVMLVAANVAGVVAFETFPWSMKPGAGAGGTDGLERGRRG